MSQKKVVLKFSPEILKHEEKNLYAASIRGLGLTSYGSNPDESLSGLERLFYVFVTRHRALNTLDRVIERSGLDWSSADEYPGTPRYKDVTPKDAQALDVLPPAVTWTTFHPGVIRLAA